jgi:hypothetical protein
MSGSNYLFEGLAPFKRYLSLPSTNVHVDTSTAEEEGDGMEDWGIDTHDFRSLSSPTLVTEDTHGSIDMNGDTPRVEGVEFWGMSPEKKQQKNHRKHWLVSDLCEELYKRNMDVELDFTEFLEEFRYILVTSQLLDETILISRFYNKRKSSHFQLNEKKITWTKYGKVVRLGSQYRLSPRTNNGALIKSIIELNKFKIGSPQQVEHLIVNALLNLDIHIRSKALTSQLIQTTVLNKLKVFMKTFQKFDVLAQKLLTKYREAMLYSNLIPQANESETLDSNKLFEILSSVTTLAFQSLVNGLNGLLPLVNGNDFENCCEIYNVDLSEMVMTLDDEDTNSRSIDSLALRVKKFQYLRRFFICSLLAINVKQSSQSDFMAKVSNLFQPDIKQHNTTFHKWSSVSRILGEEHQLIVSLIVSMNTFIQLQKIKFGPTSLGSDMVQGPKIQGPTMELSRKVKELQLELLSFDKSLSTGDQLLKFRAIQPHLDSLMEQYQKNLNELEASSNQRPFKLNKQRVTSTTRKRFSLPPLQHTQNMSPSQSPRSASSSPTNYKRLSSGLGLPLVTVMESDETKDIEYIQGLISNDDSVVITSNTDDHSFETLNNELLKEQLEHNFSRFASTSTALGVNEANPIKSVPNGEINKNDQHVDALVGISLLDEMKATFGAKAD